MFQEPEPPVPNIKKMFKEKGKIENDLPKNT